ncbi:molybdenum ABC transporter ATP-binding protein [Segnochrobactraceae bacterium EtOH-i3]
MTLTVDVTLTRGAFTLAAAFTAPAGLTVLFGRSGSGKTTLIDLIGGLARPDRGHVVLDGRVLADAGTRTFVPPSRRRLGYVFQEARLFPHFSVRTNLLYGRFFTPKAERRESLDRVLELLGIAHLVDRKPAGLSGGERQRVAIGRALMASPRLLLMDEPLAALDDARKAEILPYIERLRDEARLPIVYVTHALAEVARLATTLVVLEDGRSVAAGPATEVFSRLDLGALSADPGAVLDGSVVARDGGITEVQTGAGLLRLPGLDHTGGTRVRVRVRALDVILATEPPKGLSALNILSGTVAEVALRPGDVADVALMCRKARLIARVTTGSLARLGLMPGRPVHAIIKAVALESAVFGDTHPG